MDAPEELLLDLNALAEGHSYLGVGAYVVSDDGHWLAYSLDTTGYRQYTLHVKDLRTGQTSSEQIDRVGSVVWASDNRTLFYTTEDAGLEALRQGLAARRRRTASELVFEERDELFDVAASRSLDRKMIFFGSFAKTTSRAAVPCVPTTRPASFGSFCRGRPGTSTTSITTKAGSTSAPTRERRTSGSSPRRSRIPRKPGWTSFIDAQPRREDREHDVLRPTRRRHRAGRRSVVPARDRHEDAGVAPHHDRGAGLRPRRSPRIPSTTPTRCASRTSRW